jgi:KaiC/GvpD/RAD55 family RecA-like ATPase
MVSKAQVMALAAGDAWLEKGANILLFGPPGGGKSHLSAALGLALVENGWRVLFTRTTDLVQQLQVARRDLTLESSQWYKISVRVKSARVEVRVDQEPLLDMARTGHAFAVPEWCDGFKPLGVLAWRSTLAVRSHESTSLESLSVRLLKASSAFSYALLDSSCLFIVRRTPAFFCHDLASSGFFFSSTSRRPSAF